MLTAALIPDTPGPWTSLAMPLGWSWWLVVRRSDRAVAVAIVRRAGG